jgi:hypothetical protein
MVTIPISAVNLVTILELIGLSRLYWSILHIWAISKQNSELNIFELEEKTKNHLGLQLSLDDLLSLSKQLEQVNECTIVGVNSTELFPDRDLPLDELRKLCDVVIEAVDSTAWEISVKDVELSQRLAEKFT